MPWETVDAGRIYVARPARPGPGILLLHAWWGLTPDFTAICDRLAAEGFLVAAPDLHQGRTTADPDEAVALAEERDPYDRARQAAEVLAWLRGHPDLAAPGRVGVAGFSLGACIALLMASQTPVDALVIHYGTTGPMAIGPTGIPVLGHFAESDPWEAIEDVAALEQRLGPLATFHTYPGTGHWFMEPSNPAYATAAAELAWDRTLSFLRTHLLRS